MSSVIESYKKDFFLLLEAGFIAINMQDEDSAKKLFDACQTLDPHHAFPKIGMGYMHLCKLELAKANLFLNEALKIDPENQLAKSLLAVCMTMNPTQQQDGEKQLAELSKSSDADIKKLADVASDFSKKIYAKASSPANPTNNKK
jgi:Tfp pilus assembly protein PilF